MKRKFSSFFKSLVIELDKDLYGPDNHLVEVSFQSTLISKDPDFSLEANISVTYTHVIASKHTVHG